MSGFVNGLFKIQARLQLDGATGSNVPVYLYNPALNTPPVTIAVK